jgi:hypothetical protein
VYDVWSFVVGWLGADGARGSGVLLAGLGGDEGDSAAVEDVEDESAAVEGAEAEVAAAVGPNARVVRPGRRLRAG